jgi:hypothetical protein
MTNIVEIAKPFIDMASSNPWVAGGMVAGGVLITIFGWVREKRKARKAGKNVGNK